jgi:hypothetical protein
VRFLKEANRLNDFDSLSALLNLIWWVIILACAYYLLSTVRRINKKLEALLEGIKKLEKMLEEKRNKE